ncbi:DNA-binding response regulator [Deltaproteobacteria bacterium Smac51]|nr:DNA-binding response regulator [Deltaproteobacteria bacterium Smac51]
MKRILIIDDDQELCGLVSDYLEAEGFQCASVHDGGAGLQKALDDAAGIDLILLDIMLPVKDGFEVLGEMRKSPAAPPVIMLTAKGDSVDKIVGLEMGADDYMSKPFNPRELLARIRAVLRRFQDTRVSGGKGTISETGGSDFKLDEQVFEASYQGRPLNLTPVEFKLLQIFVANTGLIITRDKLFKEALGRREHAFDRSLDMHVSRLRKKIWPDSGGTERLKSIRGEGYLLVPERGSE